MSELKSKRTTRASTRNQEPEIVPPPRRLPQPERQPTQARSNGRKRAPQQNTLVGMGFLREQAQPVPEQKQILSSVKELLKTTSIESIMQNCPMIRSFFNKLCEKSFVEGKLAMRCLDKYFHGNTISLWESKYAPKDLEDIFQVDFAEKVHQWIKDFYYFRKKNQELDFGFDFIDDEPESYSKSLEARMREYGWNCRALVLKGRTGVGKSSLLTSIAKSMQIKCFEFSSAFDQLQKMKELEDGSRSEVITNMNANKKKQIQDNKIIMGNQSIACFMPGMKNDRDTTLQTRQPKRMQIFRDFSQYYPPFEKSEKQGIQQTYFKCLFDKIEKSTFPYALTSTKFDVSFKQKNLNSKLSNYDEIQFIEPSVEDLTKFFWLILQIESRINLQINKKIRKDDLFLELNNQFTSINLDEEFNDVEFIEKIVRKANKKLHYIFKYLQFRILPNLNIQRFLKKARIDLERERDAQQTENNPSQEQQQIINENSFNRSNSQNSHKNGDKISVQQKDEKKENKKNEEQIFQQQILQQISFDILNNINSEDLINNIQWCFFPRQYIAQENQKIEPIEIQQSQKSKQKVMPKYKAVMSKKEQGATTPLKTNETNNRNLEETHERSTYKNAQLMLEEGNQQKMIQEKKQIAKQAQNPPVPPKRSKFRNKLMNRRNMFKLGNIYQSQMKTENNPAVQSESRKKIRQRREQLSMKAVQDRLIFHNEYYHHFSNKIPHESNELMLVKTETHARAKRNILRKMKKHYLASSSFVDSSVAYRNSMIQLLNRVCRRPLEMFYLPLGLGCRRSGRSRRIRETKVDEQLQKILQERRELEYIMKFTKFIGMERSEQN